MDLREYQALSAIERTKSSIYSHLFTLFVTIFGGVLAYAIQTDKPGVAAVLPILGLPWWTFTLFNQLYLEVIREELADFEERHHREISVKWYSLVFRERIHKSIYVTLQFVVGTMLILGAFVCVLLGYNGVQVLAAAVGIEISEGAKGAAAIFYAVVLLVLYGLITLRMRQRHEAAKKHRRGDRQDQGQGTSPGGPTAGTGQITTTSFGAD